MEAVVGTYNADLKKSKVTSRLLTGFDDPSFTETNWMKLLEKNKDHTVNLTWRWQRSWWQSHNSGELMLIVAEIDNKPVALAPLFSSGGMVFNLCPEDALDLVGDVSAPGVLESLLESAILNTPAFVGFKFYFIPDDCATGKYLTAAAKKLSLDCFDEDSLPSPYMDLSDKETALLATRKKSLIRHENYFKREGKLEVFHYKQADEIEPYLDIFFQQHISRRDSTEAESLFKNINEQEYYRRLTKEIASTGWLRFTCLKWNDEPVAFHFGLAYNGRYLFGIPSFDINLSKNSPGEVLLRQVLLSAIEEGAKTFDFGIGDEAYKYRFATGVTNLHTWGLYKK